MPPSLLDKLNSKLGAVSLGEPRFSLKLGGHNTIPQRAPVPKRVQLEKLRRQGKATRVTLAPLGIYPNS